MAGKFPIMSGKPQLHLFMVEWHAKDDPREGRRLIWAASMDQAVADTTAQLRAQDSTIQFQWTANDLSDYEAIYRTAVNSHYTTRELLLKMLEVM